MKTFETLYKRTKTGAIQYWKVRVDEGDIDHAPIIIKESGQYGTISPVINTETIYQGMNRGKSNETTPVQQAKLQAESDWKKKKDSGYKTLEDLQIKDVQDPIWQGSRYFYQKGWYCLSDVLEKALPKFNSDAQGMPKPMLAKDWKKVKNIQYPCIIEPKLDGVRCLMIVTPATGNVVFLSRSGKEYTSLQHIKEEFNLEVLNRIQDDFVLDGEIYSDELTFQEIVAAVKKTSPNSLRLHFRAYDLINDSTQLGRRREMEELVELIDSEFIVPIFWSTVKSETEVKSMHDSFVQTGNEGAILRITIGKYEQGFRSSNLLKVKEFDETEFEVIRLEYGQRGIEDLLAVCQLSERVKEFKAKVEGSREQKIKFEQEYQEAYESEKTSKLTVKHFGRTTDGLPRFPIGKTLRNYE